MTPVARVSRAIRFETEQVPGHNFVNKDFRRLCLDEPGQ